MKKAFLLTLKQDFNDTEKIVFLDRCAAENYFRECIKQAFQDNETDQDDNGNDIENCIFNYEMISGAYSATLEEIFFYDK